MKALGVLQAALRGPRRAGGVAIIDGDSLTATKEGARDDIGLSGVTARKRARTSARGRGGVLRYGLQQVCKSGNGYRGVLQQKSDTSLLLDEKGKLRLGQYE